MSLFSSEYECKLDVKGRLMLPAKIKTALPKSNSKDIILRRGFEQCIIMYSGVEFQKINAKVAGLNEFNEDYRNFQRSFFRGMCEVEMDTTGRLLIPKTLMHFADIEREVILVGLGNRVEIWNPKLYEKNVISDSAELSALAQKYLDN